MMPLVPTLLTVDPHNSIPVCKKYSISKNNSRTATHFQCNRHRLLESVQDEFAVVDDCLKVRGVFSTSQTAVAIGIRGAFDI